MIVAEKINIAKFEPFVPALFFAGYFLPFKAVLALAFLPAALFFPASFDRKKRIALMFSLFLLFSGHAIKNRDDSLSPGVFSNKISTPFFIENSRRSLSVLASQTENRQLVKALSTGEREFSESFRDSLIVTGTMHLVAISAFHTGIMIMFLNILFKTIFLFFTVSYKYSTAIALFAKLTASAYYFYLTGTSIPTLRALIFILIYDAVYASGKKPDPLTLYFYSLAGVSIFIPQSASSISFMMSALCVATVIQVWSKLPSSMTVRIITVSILINYALIPVSSYLTGAFPLASPFVNLMVIPLVSLAVPFISIAQFSAIFSGNTALFFLKAADFIFTPVAFHVEYFSEMATKLMMPLLNPPFAIKILFTASFFTALSSRKKTNLFFTALNLFFFMLFIFPYKNDDIKVTKPSSLYGAATCVVFSDGKGELYFDNFRNNPGATRRFYHRMERAAAECGINRVVTVTTSTDFNEETVNKLKKRWRFKNTLFRSYHPDLTFDRNQLCESSLQLSDQVQ